MTCRTDNGLAARIAPATACAILLFAAGCQQPPAPATPTAANETPTTIPSEQVPAPRPEPTSPIPPEAAMIGTNLAVAEFGKSPGVFGKDYAYPGARSMDYMVKTGMRIARVPFKWERVQDEPMGELDPDDMGRLDKVVADARERGIRLLLDVHNYARRKVNGKGHLIGTPELPNAAFADFWRKLAMHYRDEEAVFAYGLMNEPHDTKGLWPAAAQAAIDAIREVDMKTCIFVCGDSWGGAHSWKRANANLLLNDPADNLVYEAHQYFDADSSGSYRVSYDQSGADPMIGVRRLQPFIEWLEEHDQRGFIGEFGVPGDDPRWLVVLDNFLAEMKKHDIGGSYWASGPWWGGYALSLEPKKDGSDQPQMAVMSLYVGDGIAESDKPWVKAAAEFDASAAQRQKERIEAKKARMAGAGEKMLYDFTKKHTSYTYKNDKSTIDITAVPGGRLAKYRHAGKIAYTGIGLYFGALDTEGYSKFVIRVKAKKPCGARLKAIAPDGTEYGGHIKIGTEIRTIDVPFSSLRKGDKAFTSAGSLQKFHIQPGTDRSGNELLLVSFSMAP